MNESAWSVGDERFLSAIGVAADLPTDEASHGRRPSCYIVLAWVAIVIAVVFMEFAYWYSRL